MGSYENYLRQNSLMALCVSQVKEEIALQKEREKGVGWGGEKHMI